MGECLLVAREVKGKSVVETTGDPEKGGYTVGASIEYYVCPTVAVRLQNYIFF
jgi:hypothetical protein